MNRKGIHLHIGIDDTDSPRKGCTTYIAALLVEELNKRGCRFLDYPNLIRLNPNIPWKTRGNGAIALRVSIRSDHVTSIKNIIVKIVKEHSDLSYPRTDPAIGFLKGSVPEELKKFSKNAIQNLIQLDETENIASKYNIQLYSLRGERGVVGALAAIGGTLYNDYTYELITYRKPESRGIPRKIDEDSVIEMDKATYPYTFNNYDYEKRRLLIAPNGPDPILFGIRGESPEILLKAFKIVKTDESIERWMIFRSNQGTDSHLRSINSLVEVKPYLPLRVKGNVSSKPRKIKGGHVIFSLTDKSNTINCAAYEPTGSFRNIVARLEPEDEIEIAGGVRPPSEIYRATLNLEQLKILRLVEKTISENPLCSRCGKRMESGGKAQGYRCKKCNMKEYSKRIVQINRNIKPGFFLPPPRAHRHLTKPLQRFGLEKRKPPEILKQPWNSYF